MFGLGFSEILVVLVVALLVFGPKRLPEIARTLGKSMGEMRKALDEVKREVNEVQSGNPETPSERRLAEASTQSQDKATEEQRETESGDTESGNAKSTNAALAQPLEKEQG